MGTQKDLVHECTYWVSLAIQSVHMSFSENSITKLYLKNGKSQRNPHKSRGNVSRRNSAAGNFETSQYTPCTFDAGHTKAIWGPLVQLQIFRKSHFQNRCLKYLPPGNSHKATIGNCESGAIVMYEEKGNFQLSIERVTMIVQRSFFF